MTQRTFHTLRSAAQASHRRDQPPSVDPGVTGESTEAVYEMTSAEYRAVQRLPRQRNDAEYEMQTALIAWRDALVGQYPVLSRLVHWPSGEHRTKQAAARIRKMGGARGLPDLWLFMPGVWNGLLFPALCIELKAGKNKLSADQVEWRAILGVDCGFHYEIVHDDWTIAARLVAAWCGLPEEVVP